MKTPIADFIKEYEEQDMTRLHMPGHKGQAFVGCEAYDITEVAGADSLYEADGIIAESEANATSLFGTARTVYSTEGSSQCIRAMLYLAMMNRKQGTKPVVLATRNAHKAFLYAVAVLDIEVVWLWPEEEAYFLCSCPISAKKIDEMLSCMDEPPMAVYVTSPDYLGGQLDIPSIAEVCHRNGTILAVDNAHGAYLHFLEPSQHPMDLGADICCDSAHKTLSVLTGGAYLHISKSAPVDFVKQAKQAMALFGSTSPSYLIMMSLDVCNSYLAEEYRDLLAQTIEHVDELKAELQKNGWQVVETEPLKLTVRMPKGVSGVQMAEKLRKAYVECEYADSEYVVCMFTPENLERDYARVLHAFGENREPYEEREQLQTKNCIRALSIRDAMFAKQETVLAKDALGRICGAPTVSCPPAIPIVVSGEVIGEEALQLFDYYGIETVDVLKE